MKRLLAFVLLVAVMCLLTGCDLFHKGETKIAGVWVSRENLDKYDFKGAEAKLKGDTYCKKCDRFIEGKVRICPNCGQYI